MTTQTLGLEDLIRLIDELRLAGHAVGTRQYLDAQRLLIALAEQGRHPRRLLDLCPHLAPVLCSTPKEQEYFYNFFPQWLGRQQHLAQDSDLASQPGPGVVSRPPAKKRRRWSSARPLLVVIAVAALLLVYPFAVWLDGATTRRISGVVVRRGDNAAVPGALVSFRKQGDDADGPPHASAATDTQGNFAFTYRAWDAPASLTVAHEGYEAKTHPLDASSVALPVVVTLTPVAPAPTLPSGERPRGRTGDNPAAAPAQTPTNTPTLDSLYAQTFYRRLLSAAPLLPLLLFALWWLRRSYGWRRMLLRRVRSERPLPLEHLNVKGTPEPLFQGQAFRRVVQELRRHRPRVSRDLDEPATIEATIRRGGLFTPFYGSRRTLPEYLVLIDRMGPGDQLARFQEGLVRRLAQDSLNLDTYYFRGDPRICRRQLDDAARPASYLTLPDLAALHPDYYLLIFGDGAAFIDPVTGKPERWLEHFSQWVGRAIMTPESPALWRFREWTLRESDFLVLPAGREGLEALGGAVVEDAPEVLDEQHPRSFRLFPEMLRDWPRRWLEDHEPPPEQAERLVEQLATYLGPDGMNWLAACAVYPALSWDITLYLGSELFPHREEFERTLLSLVSLPWLRHGVMPDWLRTALVSSLAPPDERAVRLALENLLVTALDAPPDGVRLDYSTRRIEPPARGRRGLRRSLREWLGARRRHRTLREIFRAAPEGSPLHDYVFLTFLSGRRPRRIDLDVPDALRRVLFPRGLEAFGPRPAALLACALLISLAAFAAVRKLDNAQRPAPTTQPSPVAKAAGESYVLKPISLSLADWPTARFDFSVESTDGVPFTTLRASDVSVTLDGQRVPVSDGDLKNQNTEQTGVVIMLDGSKSMLGDGAGGVDKFTAAKEAIRTFIEGSSPNEIIACGVFGQDVTWLSDRATGKSDLAATVGGLEIGRTNASNYTRLYSAAAAAVQKAAELKARNVILISDGREESPESQKLSGPALASFKRSREAEIINLAQKEGVRVFTVAIGVEGDIGFLGVDRQTLSNISKDSGAADTTYIDTSRLKDQAGYDRSLYQQLLNDSLSRSLEQTGQSIFFSYSLDVRLNQIVQRDDKEHALGITVSVGKPPTQLVAVYPFHLTLFNVPAVSSVPIKPAVFIAETPGAVTRAQLAALYVIGSAALAVLALFPLFARRLARGGRGSEEKSESLRKWFSGRPYMLLALSAVALAAMLRLGGVLQERWRQTLQTPGAPSESTTPAGTPRRDEMVSIPGGSFVMGRDDGDASERPAHQVTVAPFYMDKYEVTNEEYAEFVRATGYLAPQGEAAEWWTPWSGDKPPAGQENWPVRNVSAADAQAFAAWRSQSAGVKYRLPTEDEWEFAARGSAGWRYPWGDSWEEGRAAVGMNLPKSVGSYPPGASGTYDMIGNVWEWTLRASPSPDSPTQRPAGESSPLVARGGSYQSSGQGTDAVTASTRRLVPPQMRDPTLGFRLVRDAR